MSPSERPQILALAGSTRRESFNKKLLRTAASGARDAGADCTLIDLRDFPLPLYDGDLESEQGLPENAVRLRELLSNHQGLLVASPEYNGFFPAVLKNSIDWATRSAQAGADLSVITGKIVGLMGASPGPLGAMRVVGHLRTLFSGLGCVVLASQVTLRRAHEAFDGNGELANEGHRNAAMGLGAELTDWVARKSRPLD